MPRTFMAKIIFAANKTLRHLIRPRVLNTENKTLLESSNKNFLT
jgi:hypothetical protein